MSTTSSNITAPEHWNEWFEKCALALCCDETRLALGKFAYLRYERYLVIALGAGKAKSDLPIEARDLLDLNSPSSCWYDLEDSYWGRPIPKDGSTHGAAIKAAKVYKKFHLEKSSKKATPEDARDYLEAKTSENLIWSRCRTMITESMRRADGRSDEIGKSWEESYLESDSKRNSKGKELLHPLFQPKILPSPSMDTQLGEDAKQVFSKLTTEEKILILASLNEVKIENSPEIEARLGRKKSVLYKRQAAAREKIGNMLGVTGSMREYEGNPLDLGRVLGRLLDFLNEWANSPECGIGSCLMGGEVKP